MAKATKKLKCSICDKKFVQSRLKRHVKEVHQGIKNHQCSEQKFGELGILMRHVKTVHEGIKNHNCKICDKKFGYLGALKDISKRSMKESKITTAKSVTRNLAI